MYPYPFNRVHSRSRPSSRRGRSRASSISSIVSVCSAQSDDNDSNSIFSDMDCNSTHTSCSSARDEFDEGKRIAFSSLKSLTPIHAFPSARPRGPRPLPKTPLKSQSHVRATPTKPRILISLDPDFVIPYVQREEDDPYSATNSPASAALALTFVPSDAQPGYVESPLSPSSDKSKPRVRYTDTLMRDEDAELSPLEPCFNGVSNDDVIEWDHIEDYITSWDGYGQESPLLGGRG